MCPQKKIKVLFIIRRISNAPVLLEKAASQGPSLQSTEKGWWERGGNSSIEAGGRWER